MHSYKLQCMEREIDGVVTVAAETEFFIANNSA